MTSGTVAIALIVLVWLFVLAPMLLRGHKPISKAGEAFDEPRVVYEGGSKPLQPRRLPKVGAQDVHQVRAAADDLEYAPASADDEVITSESTEQVLPEVVEGQVIYELPPSEELDAVQVRVADEDAVISEFDAEDLVGEGLEDLEAEQYFAADELDHAGTPAAATDDAAAEDAPVDAYAYDDAYIGPEDMLYPGPEDTAAAPVASSHLQVVPEDADLTDEEMDFALHRSRRGGWNPQAEAAARAVRLQRRKRTIGGLALLIVLSAVAGILWGSAGWICAAIFTGFMALYLVTLRKQVRSEQQLHARRVEQLRRARLGVANAADTELGIPQRLRHPGAVVLELDDESPDFEELETVTTGMHDVDADADAVALRRVG